MDYKECINQMISSSEEVGVSYGRKVYRLKDYDIIFLMRDDDSSQYQELLMFRNGAVGELLWQYEHPKTFYETHVEGRELKLIEKSKRVYGEPKLSKPTALKGVKSNFSIAYNEHCACPVFVLGDDIWLKHRDYFSSSFVPSDGEFGVPLEAIANKYFNIDKKSKFIYPDAWGDIVLRNESWICIQNLLHHVRINPSRMNLLGKILKQQAELLGFKESDLYGSDMERFYENLLDKLYLLKAV